MNKELQAWADKNITFVGNSNTNRSSRRGQVPEMIVNHISEGTISSVINWFTNEGNDVSSSHFAVDREGKVYQFVDIEDSAWANGLTGGIENATSSLVLKKGESISPNWYSVSVEHEGFYSETKGELTAAQLESSKILHHYIIEYVYDKFNFRIEPTRERIIGHNEVNKIDRVNCPGELFPFDEIINYLQSNTERFLDLHGHWAEDLIIKAHQEGWVKGYPDGTFRPDKPVTRAEVVAMISEK
ncbi:N-acetylmuramoyl-L-alanine amidase [Herbivorax sp. ANBcel31]|uniref:N-acetylmuramoyl-L-alanine amidase n=1 Tax=Herbivorax sp. ANBcel31 TaxID=3069754 RepID=UPI0027AF5170|nr:N-acetylmuramoyl-L-alanine amidase [Herbivorax sp. ANBcel31]MDQ2086651.1 N-acetylmuramoyl-L-alanine amidase [Herbivorax sp. ANBcel31]